MATIFFIQLFVIPSYYRTICVHSENAERADAGLLAIFIAGGGDIKSTVLQENRPKIALPTSKWLLLYRRSLSKVAVLAAAIGLKMRYWSVLDLWNTPFPSQADDRQRGLPVIDKVTLERSRRADDKPQTSIEAHQILCDRRAAGVVLSDQIKIFFEWSEAARHVV